MSEIELTRNVTVKTIEEYRSENNKNVTKLKHFLVGARKALIAHEDVRSTLSLTGDTNYARVSDEVDALAETVCEWLKLVDQCARRCDNCFAQLQQWPGVVMAESARLWVAHVRGRVNYHTAEHHRADNSVGYND